MAVQVLLLEGEFVEKLVCGHPVVVNHDKTTAALAAHALETAGLDLVEPGDQRIAIGHIVLDCGLSRAVTEYLSGG
eukprot:1669017-Amphidinium_carterae.3